MSVLHRCIFSKKSLPLQTFRSAGRAVESAGRALKLKVESNMKKDLLSVFKDTVIYGASSIIGKFLNWLLVPLYTYVLQQQSDYGIVTNLYAWTALLLVILTYGMETGFFRFANREDKDARQVYSTILICIGFTSTLFAVL